MGQAPITTEGLKGKSPAGKSSKGFGKSGKPGKCASHEPSVPEHAVSKTESVAGAAALTPPPRPPATPQAKAGRSNPTPEAPPSECKGAPAKGDGKGLGKGETGPPQQRSRQALASPVKSEPPQTPKGKGHGASPLPAET